MSDYGGSAGSFRSGSVAAVNPDKFATRPGEEELDDSLSWTTGIFGVLYTVTKEKSRMKWPMIVFRLSLDFIQLFLLIVDPRYGWEINPDNGAWKAFSIVSMNWVVTAMGYTIYLALLYLMVVALLAVLAVSIWVAHSFKTSQFDYVWPITFLRWYGNIFFQVLDIASMSLLLIALDCTYLPGGEVQQGYNQEFPDVACWSGAHMIHAGVAALSLVIFVATASIFQLAEIELNPLSKNTLAIGHSATELQGFLVRVVMTFTSVFLNNAKFAANVYLICSLLLVWLYLKWIPHMNAWVNYIRVGSYTAILFASAVLIAVAFGSESSALGLTIFMILGVLPAGVCGAILAHYRTRYFLVTILGLLMDPDPKVKPQNVFRVEDPREIEILVRCCRVWLPEDEDVPDPEAVAKAEIVIKHGLLMLPKAPYMVILWSSFLIDVQSSYQSGYTQLQTAKKADPSLLERFAIFSREQQHAQQSAGSGGNPGNAMNLVSYVEFSKNLRLVVRVHREALLALKNFWTLLMHNDVTLQALTQAVRQIDEAIRAADTTYKMVMARHSTKVKIVRLYARFLEDVKQDPWSASRWFTESERLELAEEEAKNTSMFGELGIPLGGAGNSLEHLTELVDMKGGILGRQDARAMFIMNAQCIIQLASPAVLAMFGWSTAEVKGKNINMIVPPPWSEHHNSFVRNYIITGHENVLGRTTEFVALHKDRSTFAVNLCVAKISGMGEDILFMGLLEVVPPTPRTATAWVMMGSESLVSVDRSFTDHFGFKPEELLGQGWGAWIVDPEPLHKALTEMRADKLPTKADVFKRPSHGIQHTTSVIASHPSLDECVTTEVKVFHRWAQPITTRVTVHAGGVGSHPFYMMKFDLPPEPVHLLVADKAGRLLHATESLAEVLGTNVKQLMGNNMQGALQALMPQPFAALHEPGLVLPKLDLPASPPPHSCRSGLSVMLICQQKKGPPTVQPFQIKLSKEYEPNAGPGDALHVLHLHHKSMQEALAERRLRVLLDNQGRVHALLSGSEQVFDFDPEALVGTLLSDFVPGFKDEGILIGSSLGHLSATPGLEELEHEVVRGHSPSLTKTLALMAAKALESPGVSWRVGLVPPVVDSSLGSDLELQAHLSGQAAGAMPTIMAVTTRSRKGKANATQATGGPAAAEEAAFQEVVDKTPGSFFLILDLWRADLVASVLELDDDGVVSHSTALPLYPPGLSFGQPAVKVVGQHIRTLLPMPVGGSPLFFFQPVVRQDDKQETAKKRSNLKASATHNKKAPGPVNVYRTVHQTDSDALDVEVQAVPGRGATRSGGMYLIVRPINPSCGPIDLCAALHASSLPGRTKPKVPMAASDQEDQPEDIVLTIRKNTKTVKSSSNLQQAPSQELMGHALAMPNILEEFELSNTLHCPVPPLGPKPAVRLLPGNTIPQGSFSGQADNVKFDVSDHGGCHDNGNTANHMLTSRTEEWVLSDGTSAGHKVSGAGILPTVWQPVTADGGSDDAEIGYEKGNTRNFGEGDNSVRGQHRYMQGDPVPDYDVYKEDKTSEQEHDMAAAVDTLQRSTDYKRGQRFKRLLRLLSSTAVQKPFERFKLHAHIVIIAMILLSVGFFVLQFTLLNQQREGVDDLNSVGIAGRVVGRIMQSMREIDILLNGRGVSNLPGLTSIADLPDRLDVLERNIELLKELHRGVYLGFGGKQRKLPAEFGLRELWDEASLNETVYLDTKPNFTVLAAKTSLWDGGNSYLAKGDEVVANSLEHFAATNNFIGWSAVRYIVTNGPSLMQQSYYNTMDGFLQLVIQQADYINRIQLLVLIIQGVVVPCLALIYMWVLATSVTRLQFRIYQVFIMVPVGLVKALATKPIVLDEEDEEDEDEVAVNLPATEAPEAPTVVKATSLAVQVKSSNAAQTEEKDDLANTGRTFKERTVLALKRLGSSLAFWQAGKSVTTGKRKLRSTHRIAFNLTWPYAAVALINISVNSIAYQKISSAGSRIATFNIVNFAAARLQRVYFFAQELCAIDDPVVKEETRTTLRARYGPLAFEYNAMMYGHEVVANETAPRFRLAKEGVIYSGGEGPQLLFYTTDCLRANKSSCMTEDDSLYQTTHNGLDRLFRNWFQLVTTMYSEPAGPFPRLNGSQCEFLWRTKPDIQDGIEKLSQVYHEYVLSVYTTATLLHTVNLALSIACFVTFYFLVLKPFWTQCKSDRRRIAELLSQLPQEVSVDELVVRSLELDKSALAAGGNSSMGSMGSMHA